MAHISPLPIPDAFELQTPVHEDSRGKFEVSWEHDLLATANIQFQPSNAHHSYNIESGTLRGLHFQRSPYGQAKLVSCVSGRIWDVMVDTRPDSPSSRKWHATELTAASGKSVFVPAGCAHGFVTLQPNSTLAYLIEGEYQPSAGGVLRWNDSTVAINWPINDPTLSDKDATAPDWDACEF